MSKGDGIDCAIASLVEAALDPERWPSALDAMASACGARSGQLISLNQTGAVTAHWLTEVPEGFTREVEAFGLANPTVNPRVRLGLQADLMTPVADQDYVDDEARDRLPIYAEMFLPHDLAFNCQAVLLRDSERLVRTSVTRTKKEGPLDADALRAFAALLPYVRASARFQATLERAKLDSALLALNAIAAPAFLLDGGGRVVGASAAGEKLASEQSVIRITAKRLQPILDRERSRFDARLDAAVEAARAGRGACVGPLVASNKKGEIAVILDVQPLPLDRAGFGDGPAVLVIARPAAKQDERASVLKRLFQLTDAEAAVAGQLVEGRSLARIAEARGVSLATVRSQIQVVYGKMGVHRQAELVAAVRRLG